MYRVINLYNATTTYFNNLIEAKKYVVENHDKSSTIQHRIIKHRHSVVFRMVKTQRKGYV